MSIFLHGHATRKSGRTSTYRIWQGMGTLLVKFVGKNEKIFLKNKRKRKFAVTLDIGSGADL